MKKISAVIWGLLFTLLTREAFAQPDITQVQGQPVVDSQDDSKLIESADDDNQPEKDYQKNILSNKDINEMARTKSLTGNGGNTAIIIQNGRNNNSNIIQSGDNNYAKHTQDGDENHIKLKQQGKNNHSEEKQTGKYNRKEIIQNGDSKTTVIIEQVGK